MRLNQPNYIAAELLRTISLRDHYTRVRDVKNYKRLRNKCVPMNRKAKKEYYWKEKAFDPVNHQILIQELRIYQLDNNFVNLIRSYLTDRKQLTSINGYKSQYQMIIWEYYKVRF